MITGNANPIVTGNANNNGSNNSAVVTGNANDNGSNNSVKVTGNANPVITGNANPIVTGNANDNGSNNSAVVTGNANPTVVVTGNLNDNGSNNTVEVTGNANPIVTGNANGGLFGGSSKRGNVDKSRAGEQEGAGKGGSSLLDANVDVAGGSSDPRCIAPLVGLGLPLVALVPVAIAQQVRIPGLERLAAQAERAFNDAARGINVDQATAAAIGGGAVGIVAALLVAAAARNCIPQVRGVDVTIGGSAGNSAVPTKDAPVVETKDA